MIHKLPHFLRAGLLLWVVAFGLGTTQGAVPQLINHQGQIAVDGINFDGNGQFKFALVNATGSTTYWSNDGTGNAGGQPTAAVQLGVVRGLYSVLLGDVSLPNMTAVPAAVFANTDVRLRVWFNDGSHGFQLIPPDQRLSASPYALVAENAALATSFSGSLAGDVSGTQSATSIAAPTVTGKLLTGYVSDAGSLLSADDTILTAFNKLDGNSRLKANLSSPTFTGTVGGITASMVGLGYVTNTSDADKPVSTAQQTALDLKAPLANPTFTGTVSGSFSGPLNGNATTATAFSGSLSGDVTGTQGATEISATTVTGKALTNYLSAAGTISATDSILSAINKLNGNNALKANLDSPAFTGTVLLPAGSATSAPLKLATGTSLTTPVFGSVEFDGTHLFLTNNAGSPTRKTLAFTDAPTLTGVPLAPTAASGTNTGQIATTEFVQSAIQGVVSALNNDASYVANITSALSLKAPLASPTFTGTVSGITASMVGLGNVSNTSDADKPVSTAQQAALDLKAPLASPTFTGTVSGITASMVGLGNVSNISDADKPVSTAQQTALDLKAPLASPAFTGTILLPAGSATSAPLKLATGTSLTTPVFGSVEFDGTHLFLTNNAGSPTRKTLAFTDAPALTGVPLAPTAASGTNTGQIATTEFVQSAIQGVVGAAPAALNTLHELAAALDNDASYASTITNALSLKAPLASPTFSGTTSGTFSGPLTGNVTGNVSGSASNFTGSLGGDVTGTQSATAISAATVTGKALTGYVSGAGTLSATDTILSAINKLNGNDALKANLASPTFSGTVTGSFSGPLSGNATTATTATNFSGSLSGDVTGTQSATAISAATVTGKALTGYVSGAGTLSATDTILTAINKLNGNDALKANLASPTFTGTVALPAGSTTAAPLRLTAGTNLTAATLGSVEFDGNNLYITTNAASPTRKTVALSDTGSSSQIGLSSVVAAPIYPVVAWGNNSNGQARAPVLANVAAVAAGDLHSIALLDDGQVVEWGKSVGTKPALTEVTDIAAGGSHNLVRQSNGRVLAWGANGSGQATAPTDIVTAVKVAAGARHSLALLANGTVRGWGEDYLGKNAAPASLTGMTVIAIAAGENHSLALKNTGEVVAWGDNLASQTTVPLGAQSGVTAIAAGWNHSLALKSDGSVVAWGNNNGGQTDVPAAASSGVVQIAAGDTYSMALKSDGTIVTWGFTAAETPVTVVPNGTTQVTQIAAGGYHALALRADSVPVQLARLDAAGRLGIGRTPLLNALEVEGNASKATAGSWLANSDRRIKTDIESITGALDKLDRVRLVDFRYTDAYLAAHPEIENRRYPNVIAQEFQKVFPDDVKGSGETLPDSSEILQVDTYPLTIYSAAAVQELHRENRLLKKKLDDQEQRLRKLEEILKNK